MGFLEAFKIETMLSDDFSRIHEDLWSEISVRRYVLPLELDIKVDSVLLTVYSSELEMQMFLYSLQPDGENLVTLEDTSASAVLQKDGTVLCTHEILSPKGMLSQ